MIDVEGVVIVLALCIVLSIASYRLDLLTMNGSMAALVVGILIGILGEIQWLLILILFTVTGFLVTQYKIKAKMSIRVQEGIKGERDYMNVLANGFVPVCVALGYWFSGVNFDQVMEIAFLSSICVAAADTVASEMGVLSEDTWLITTLEPVSPGTNGGVSLYGTIWSVIASAFAALIGWLLIAPAEIFNMLILIPIFMGVMGCTIDSFIGATLERRGLIGKLGNNMISMASGALGAMLLIIIL